MYVQRPDCRLQIADCGFVSSSFPHSGFWLLASGFQVLRVFPLLLYCLTLGCGYHFSGIRALPQGIQRVSFAEFDNETLEVGVEKELQWAMEREFRNRGGITVSENGEGIVTVTLHQLDLRPLSFDLKDQAL